MIQTRNAINSPNDVLRTLAAAEATLGWPIADTNRFLFNVDAHGLGEALNLEHDYLP